MTVYVDLIFFINFFYDLLLLLTVSVVLKRQRKFYFHLLSAFVGALSIFLLFFKLSSIILFIIKIIISMVMCIISYGYVSFKYTMNNMLYFYMSSVILAGFLYFLNVEFSYEHVGMLFVSKGLPINFIFLLIVSPVILFIYIRSSKKLKSTYSNYYQVEIFFDNYQINCVGLYDSGNNLRDPITGKPVIILSPNLLKGIYNIRSPIYVPYNTVSGSSIMKCFKPSYIIINNHKIYNYLVGESKKTFSDGVKCILNTKLMEDNYV